MKSRVGLFSCYWSADEQPIWIQGDDIECHWKTELEVLLVFQVLVESQRKTKYAFWEVGQKPNATIERKKKSRKYEIKSKKVGKATKD